jgi:PIN domain nuclease of toxin-antitoxin system
MTTYVLDTHALVWFLEKNPHPSNNVRLAILDANAEIVIPTIVLTEVVFLYSRKKIKTNLPTVLAGVAGAANCTVYPLDEEVVLRLPTNLDIHDAIIVATSLLYRDLMGRDVAVLTRDELIRNANLIRTIW